MTKMKYPTKISIVWTIDDIDTLLENNGLVAVPELTEQEKAHILHEVYEHHNAENGVSWDSLLCWTNTLYKQRLQSIH